MKGVEWSMKQKIDKIIVVLSNMQKKQERLKKEQGMVRESLVAEKGEKGMEKWDMLKINVEIINDLK